MADHQKTGARKEKPGRTPNRSPFASPAAWLILIALAVFLFRAFQDVGVRRVGYSQWKEMLKSGTFQRVVVGPDWVRGYPKPAAASPEGDSSKSRTAQGLPYVATRLSGDDELVKQIEASRVEYDAVSSSGIGDLFWVWIVPIALGLLFWGWVMRRMTGQLGQGPPGVMSFGK